MGLRILNNIECAISGISIERSCAYANQTYADLCGFMATRENDPTERRKLLREAREAQQNADEHRREMRRYMTDPYKR